MDKLRHLVGSTDERVALKAAKELLAVTVRIREATEIEERLAALEMRWAEKGKSL